MESGGTVGPEVDQGRATSVCPGLTPTADVEGSRWEVFSRGRDELDRILRVELGGSRVTSTPVKGLWPIYSERRSSVLRGMRHLPVSLCDSEWLTRLNLLNVGIDHGVV